MQATQVNHERRYGERKDLARSVKVYDAKTHRYQPAHTRNVSSTGVMLQVYGGTHLCPGDRIGLAIDWDERESMFCQTQMARAVVVRAGSEYDGYRDVAVKFIEAQELPLVA